MKAFFICTLAASKGFFCNIFSIGHQIGGPVLLAKWLCRTLLIHLTAKFVTIQTTWVIFFIFSGDYWLFLFFGSCIGLLFLFFYFIFRRRILVRVLFLNFSGLLCTLFQFLLCILFISISCIWCRVVRVLKHIFFFYFFLGRIFRLRLRFWVLLILFEERFGILLHHFLPVVFGSRFFRIHSQFFALTLRLNSTIKFILYLNILLFDFYWIWYRGIILRIYFVFILGINFVFILRRYFVFILSTNLVFILRRYFVIIFRRY